MQHGLPAEQTKILQITILAVGSRGDVQPYYALALGLQRAGHQVQIATHANFEAFVSHQGLEFAPVAGDYNQLLRSEEGQKLLEGERVKLVSDELFQQQMADAWVACQGTDVVIFNPLATWGYNIAEKLAVPCFMAATMPLSPTRTFPFLNFALASRTSFDRLRNYASYLLVEFLFWQQQRKQVNLFRQQTLGLPPLPFLGARFRSKKPHNLYPLRVLYGFSPIVIPKPPDWPEFLNVTGYWLLDQAKDYQPPKELLGFLDDGPPPVSVGFGSMTIRNLQLVTKLVIEALEESQQRGILLSGWAGIGNVNLPDRVFVIDDVPHDWLFPRMAAVVHHGGASTTAAGLRAGVPSVIVPFFADQPAWGQRLAELGVSPPPVPYKELSVKRLAATIRRAVSDKVMREQAIALGKRIRAEDGVAKAVEAFYRCL
ncbi:UDP-glucose:sterol glucosyltransferase [uncultured Leptolyngbya sp.]|uniref:UDP-glucose:sterol glucosyltransferase n=1 Tax=uncultured Leptolyngbya sp. TaxID=332963 RepID=A0A6J4KF37_9CYAN|nr:UDP-glucose:sterol glucosyltransferase [uncultured Leptolyngbya sp.]